MRSLIETQRFRPQLWGVLVNRSFLSRYYLYRSLARHARSASGRLLDFGCGAKPYRSLFQVSSYIGVDIAVSGHDHAQEDIDVYYDGKVLPFADESFDFIFSSEVLEHVFNLDEIMSELHRVSAPGGKLLISIPFAYPEHEVPFDFARYTRYAMRSLLEKHGFTLLALEGTTGFSSSLCQLSIEAAAARCLPLLPRWSRIFFQLFWALPITLLGMLLNIGEKAKSSFPLNYVIFAEKGRGRGH